MNIQIFGKSKCFDTKKAERYFKERGIKFQSIDILSKGMSKGEFNSVSSAVGGYENLVDTSSKVYKESTMQYLAYEEDKIENELLKNVDNDIRKGSTSCGPHRDDFGFYIDGKNVATQGSQGQQRNVLITIKLAFVEMIKKQKEEEPILLLDDVFSELDKVRQNNLLEAVNNGIQTIISSATLSEIDENLIKNALVITLKKEENGNG